MFSPPFWTIVCPCSSGAWPMHRAPLPVQGHMGLVLRAFEIVPATPAGGGRAASGLSAIVVREAIPTIGIDAYGVGAPRRLIVRRRRAADPGYDGPETLVGVGIARLTGRAVGCL